MLMNCWLTHFVVQVGIKAVVAFACAFAFTFRKHLEFTCNSIEKHTFKDFKAEKLHFNAESSIYFCLCLIDLNPIPVSQYGFENLLVCDQTQDKGNSVDLWGLVN